MIQVDRFRNSRLLIKVEEVSLQIVEIDYAADVALEMAMINRIEANECAKETPVRLNDARAEKIPMSGQAKFQQIQRCKELAACFFVGCLTRGKPCPIHAIVDLLINQMGQFRVSGLQLRREKIDTSVLHLSK